MHVVYLHPHFIYPGGAGTFVLETAKRLAEQGIKVSIIAQSGASDLIQNYPKINFEFVGGPLPNTITYWANYFLIYKKVERILDKISPNIIFPQVFPANYWGFLYKKHNPKITCIWYVHDMNAFVHEKRVIEGLANPMRSLAKVSNPLMKIIDKHLVSRVDYFLFNSNFTAERCREIYDISGNKVIYPGVDLSRYPTNPKEKEDYILCVSMLSKFKRIDLALDALYILKKMGINQKLVIVGDGEERINLVKQSQILGLADAVTFTGKLSGDILMSYYSKAQCVIFPSVDEPFGIVPIEAQAAWTPVIAARSGGPMESVIDGESGFLVNPNSAEQIADKILCILQNKGLSKAMGNKGRKNIENKFSWDITTHVILKVFKDICNCE